MSDNQPHKPCTSDSAINKTVQPVQCTGVTSLNSTNPFLVTPTNPFLSSTNPFLVPMENIAVNNNGNPFFSNVATGFMNVNHSSHVSDAERVIDRAYDRHVRVDGTVAPCLDVDGADILPAGGSLAHTTYQIPGGRLLHSTAYPDVQNNSRNLPVGDVGGYGINNNHSFRGVSHGCDSEKKIELLLRSLVEQFTEAVQNMSSRSTSHKVDFRLPRFDGSTDVHLFIKQFRDIWELNHWSDRVALVQLRSCLEKGAKDCGRADSVPEINRLLLAAYGISSSEARNRLHHLRRGPEENFLSFGARVERLARIGYGEWAVI